MAIVISVLLVLHLVVATYLVVYVLRSSSEPSAMVAWILIVLMFPLVGSSIYALVGESRIAARAERRRTKRLGVDDRFAKWFKDHVAADRTCPIGELLLPMRRIAVTAKVLANCPVTADNSVEVIDDSEAFHHRVITEIMSARRNLNILFYIWGPDDSGREVLDAVIARAKAGVACRILLDAAGSVHVPRKFLHSAEAAGVKVRFFMPLWPSTRRYSAHLRNHRKIVVVDGLRALVGSQNIGDIERGCGRIRPYQQVSLAISGPAVHHMQAVFAGDWNAFGGEMLDNDAYFPPANFPGNAALQVVATGPDQPYHVVERILFEALSSAEKEVWVATPYFVPSETVRLALGQASIRGVSVNLVIPGKSDRAVALWAARSFYGELITEGVKIHEHSVGMVHSKIVAIDKRWCMVGTANMDLRSFRLNFEVSVLGYDETLAVTITKIIQGYVSDAKQVTAEEVSNRSYTEQLLAGAARLLASQL